MNKGEPLLPAEPTPASFTHLKRRWNKGSLRDLPKRRTSSNPVPLTEAQIRHKVRQSPFPCHKHSLFDKLLCAPLIEVWGLGFCF